MTVFLLAFLFKVYLPNLTPSVLQEKAGLTGQYLYCPELLVQSQFLMDPLSLHESCEDLWTPLQFLVHEPGRNRPCSGPR